MDWPTILLKSLWAGLFAAGLGVLLTAPSRYLVRNLLCGFVARGTRDICMGWSLGQHWSTLIAAAAVVLVAVSISRRHTVSPVVLICGVLPLGAAVAMFNLILGLMRVSATTGEALTRASVVLTGSLGTVFTTSLAIAIGLGAGISLVRLLRRDEAVAV
jgi:uncharacterized membrane protein YjjB (DUF3815 family)